jgi:starch synthase
VAYVEGFDERLAHRILAGSDIFLVPSLYEPCGLTQMYALRYGSVPVVRHTGGLADTVRDASRADGTGFVFHDYTAAALQSALSRALTRWRDRTAWTELMRRGMAKDFSWEESAAVYEQLYARLAEQEEDLA